MITEDQRYSRDREAKGTEEQWAQCIRGTVGTDDQRNRGYKRPVEK